MKQLAYVLAFVLIMSSCNNPDQNSATGNRADSLNTADSTAVNDGPGVENSGGTGTGASTDTSQNLISTDSSHHR